MELGGDLTAYKSYRMGVSNYSNPRNAMLNTKRSQIEYLYNLAVDREEDCLLNNHLFIDSPRIFNRQIKTNYYQTVTVETINEKDRFKSGDLLTYDNDYWLCTSSFIFHNLYCRGNFIRTNYTLKWQNKDREIIERRAYIVSASQYNSGESSNKVITLGYNQYLIVLPSDDETNILDRTKRFFIDKNQNEPLTYRVTRNDCIPYSDWDNGCVCLIVTEDQYNTDTDSIENWICDYKKNKKEVQKFKINCISPQIRCGGNAKTFTAETTETVTWQLKVADYQKDYIILSDIENNKCRVKCLHNNKLIGSSFKLIAKTGTCSQELLIDVIGGM